MNTYSSAQDVISADQAIGRQGRPARPWRLWEGGILLSLLLAGTPPAAAAPVISYIGGKHPHVAVNFDRTGGPWTEHAAPRSFRLRTPRGAVTVRWITAGGTDGGGPPEKDGEISHPDTVYRFVIVSPPGLPVLFRGAGDAKWVRLNGHRLRAVRPPDPPNGYPPDPIRMGGGRSRVDVGYPDVE